MGFRPMEITSREILTPTATVVKQARGAITVHLNRSALQAMDAVSPDGVTSVVIGWDQEHRQLGFRKSSDNDERYVRKHKQNSGTGAVMFGITGEVHRYSIPIDELLGRHILAYDPEREHWVAPASSNWAKVNIRSRLQAAKGGGS